MNKRVKMFGDEIIELDKTMIVMLDWQKNTQGLIKNILKDIGVEDYSLIEYDNNFKSLQDALRSKEPCIITTLTCEVSPLTMEMGYDIYVVSNGDFVLFSELLDYKDDGIGSFCREIRITQNWEKMLLSGCFNIDIPDWREDEKK